MFSIENTLFTTATKLNVLKFTVEIFHWPIQLSVAPVLCSSVGSVLVQISAVACRTLELHPAFLLAPSNVATPLLSLVH